LPILFCYIYNQGKDVCNFLFLYIPDSHYYLLFSIVLAILCMVATKYMTRHISILTCL
jgi:hypothetical protein